MKIHNRQLLTQAQTDFSEAADQLKSWYGIAKDATWASPHDVRHQFPKSKTINGKNVVFKILRTRYRLWVKVDYQNKIVLIMKFGTHRDYDKWDIK
jgi:mRNA interferase HigB